MQKTKKDFTTKYMLYKVQKGDSLWSISNKLYDTGIYWESLKLIEKHYTEQD